MTQAPAHATQAPVHTTAPPAASPSAAAQAPVRETAGALIGSLSSVPAQAQRRCAVCGGDHEEMPVQPMLNVGPVNDPYEREADNIADRVMAMREPGAVQSANPGVQRACASCASAQSADELQRMPGLTALTKDDDETPRMRASPAHSGTETIGASAAQLTSGGSALPGATRDFFEPRMGRDLSGVRVHSGSEAGRLNDSISARAFTYRNHIWLNQGETADANHTMAHELAHVLQQTAPGPLAEGAVGDDAAAPEVRRAASPVDDELYFAPADHAEGWAHDPAVKQATQVNSGLMGEVRVPNANERHSTNNHYSFGYADLVYNTDEKLWGVGFDDESRRRPLPDWARLDPESGLGPRGLHPFRNRSLAGKGLIFNGTQLGVSASNQRYRDQSAPYWRLSDFQRDASDAPSSYEIGDMKPAGYGSLLGSARSQTQRYATGFNDAKDSYNQVVDQNNAIIPGSNTSGSRLGLLARSNFSASQMSSDIQTNFEEVPEGLDLVLKENNRGIVSQRNVTYRGKAYFRQNPTQKFLWEYVYWPDAPGEQDNTSNRSLRRSRLTQASSDLYEQLTTMPTDRAMPRRLPKASPVAPKVMRNRRPPTADPFNTRYTTWRNEQRAFTRTFSNYAGRSGTGASEIGTLAFDTAIQNTVRVLGGVAPRGTVPHQNTTALTQAQRQYSHAELIEGRSGRLLGQVRKTFGRAFIKAINIYQRLRTKFQEFMERGRRARSYSRPKLKAIMKVGGMILGIIIRELLPKVASHLITCLEQGFTAMFTDFLGQDFSDMTDEAEQAFMQRYENIAQGVEAQIESAADDIKARYGEIYESVMSHWESAGTLLRIANHVINLARIAACAAGGLETVGISCVVAGADYLLSLFNASPVDHLSGAVLEWLMSSCPAQEYIAEFVLGRAVIRNLPLEIAETIRSNVKGVLPDEISGIICDELSGAPELPDVDEIPCDDPDHPGRGGSDLSQLPPGIPSNAVNREATAEERAAGGQLRRPTRAERRNPNSLDRSMLPQAARDALEPEPDPPPGTPEVWDPPQTAVAEGETPSADRPGSSEAAEAPRPSGGEQEVPPVVAGTEAIPNTDVVEDTDDSDAPAPDQAQERIRDELHREPVISGTPNLTIPTNVILTPVSGSLSIGPYSGENPRRVLLQLHTVEDPPTSMGPHMVEVELTNVYQSGDDLLVDFDTTEFLYFYHGNDAGALELRLPPSTYWAYLRQRQ